MLTVWRIADIPMIPPLAMCLNSVRGRNADSHHFAFPEDVSGIALSPALDATTMRANSSIYSRVRASWFRWLRSMR